MHEQITQKRMRIVIQRVRHASLSIGGQEYSSIREGMVVLVGVEERDTIDDVEWLVKRQLSCAYIMTRMV